MSLPRTHLFAVRDRLGAEISHAPLDRTFDQAVADLGDGTLMPALTLVSVLAFDVAAGTCADVTARALHAVAAYVDADLRAVPANLRDAFAAYDVPLPEFVEREEVRDPHAEHRLTAADYGLTQRAV